MKIKKRLDLAIQKLYPNLTRQQIQSFIIQGKALVNDVVQTKAGSQVTEFDKIILLQKEQKFVGRAGYKLEYALDTFKIDVKDRIILDAGISTGGFSDCMLQRNAAKIHGVDVGYGQTADKIRKDHRVILYERTNIRHIDHKTIGEYVDIVTLDLSFISILKVLDAINTVLKPNGILITLIKPQFEAQRNEIGSGGIIRDNTVRERIVKSVINGIITAGFTYQDSRESVIQGTDGNREYIAWFLKKQTIKQN